MIEIIKRLFFLSVILSFLAGLGLGCQADGKGHLEYGLRASTEWTFYSRASEGGASNEIKSTLVDNIVEALKPDGVGPPAPEPDGP